MPTTPGGVRPLATTADANMNCATAAPNPLRAIARAAVFATLFVVVVLVYAMSAGLARPVAMTTYVALQAYACAAVTGLFLRKPGAQSWLRIGSVWCATFLLWRVVSVLAGYANSFGAGQG